MCMHAACRVHVIIFSTGGKFQPVSNLMELHALTLAARSYAHLARHNYCFQCHIQERKGLVIGFCMHAKYTA